MNTLDGRVAVVTGAASGIGRSMVIAMARAGMAVVLADRDAASLEEAHRAVTQIGAVVVSVPTDVTSWQSVEALAAAVQARFGGAHVVCNNAGVLGGFGETWTTPLSEWQTTFDVNLWGVVHGLRAFVPMLLGEPEGHIVNTASAAGWLSAPGLGPYAATKHAVLAISESLRLELEDRGSNVGVSVLCPQFVRTSIVASTLKQEVPVDGSRAARLRAAIARGINGGVSPDVVAQLVLDGIRENRFLISEAPEAIIASADRRVGIARGAVPRAGR